MQEDFYNADWHIRLRKVLDEYFDDSELRQICFDLKIDYEGLSGTTKPQKAIELIRRCARQRQIDKLIDICSELRPNISWTDLKEAAVRRPLIATDDSSFGAVDGNVDQNTKQNEVRPLSLKFTKIAPIVLLFIIVLIVVWVAIPISLAVKDTNVTVKTPALATETLGPTLLPKVTSSPEPTIVPYVVPIEQVVSTTGITLTIDYLKFETSRLMIHMKLDIAASEPPMNGCVLPHLIKEGYGPIPSKDIVERGGMFSRTDGSCFLEVDFLGGPGKSQEGWLVYRIASSTFITRGLYTLDSVGYLPLTTFTVK